MLSPLTVMRMLSKIGAALAFAILSPASAWATATAGATSTPPRLLSERGVLVWDPASSSQHLFVTAEIEPGEGPAGIVFTTPRVPAVEPLDDLGEAVEGLFALHRDKTDVEIAMARPSKAETTPSMRIMPAADAGSLGGWLESNDLSPHPGLVEFARDYGQRGFHYVALHLAEAPPGEARVLPWTAISFRAPGPYYPLATPRASYDQRTRLEIYTLSPELLALTLGEHFETGSAALVTRDELATAVGEAWLSATGIEKEGPSLWLQRFEPERTAMGEDGFFVRVPAPALKTIPEGATSRSRNGKRLLVLLVGVVFSASIAWLGSWERRPTFRR